MGRYKITFWNNTTKDVSFSHQFKSTSGETFRLRRQEKRAITAHVIQTNEEYWLVDSTGQRTGEYFSTDEIKDFEMVTVSEDDNGLTLTKVPRNNQKWTTAISNAVKRFAKIFVKDEDSDALPTVNQSESTRQNSSSSQRGQ